MLVVSSSGDWPLAIREMVAAHGVTVLQARSLKQACDPALLSKADAIVIHDQELAQGPESLRRDLQLLGDALTAHRLTGVLLSSDDSAPSPGLDDQSDDEIITVSGDTISADELWGRVTTIRDYRPRLRQMDQQVAVMQRLGKKLNQQFVEVDQELRLASRLQRDFLPKAFPELHDLRFAALYRPAAWVSGDTYNVARLDETHVGFYLADAVGHGIAAGLLTMFIRQAVVGKRIDGNRYTIVSPEDVLATLNRELARQELPNCQFVTACYATLDVRDYNLTFSRGGHPHPIHVSADGQCSEVHTMGGLLGVFPEESFPALTLQLQPGEKFILYSDGLEDLIVARRDRNRGRVEFTSEFCRLARDPVATCLDNLAILIDHAEGSIGPCDDMTVLGVERSQG